MEESQGKLDDLLKEKDIIDKDLVKKDEEI